MAQMPPFELREGDDRPFYDPAVQTMSQDELRALQDERLRDAVRRIFERPAPLWVAKLNAAGITGPDDVKSVDDLDAVPVTVKQELRDSEAEHPPVGGYRTTALRDNVKIGTSTGTTGTPTIALWTKHDIWVDCEAAARMFWSTGIRPGHIVTHAHPGYLYSGGPLNTAAYEHLGALCVWVPPPDTDELAEQGLSMWQRVTPDFPFMGFATGTFFTRAKHLGIDPMDVGLDFSKMNAPVGSDGVLGLMTAGAECFPYLGNMCGNKLGAHLAQDYTHVQALGEDGRPVPDGQWGRLVVTTFGRDNVMLRYDLEEAARLDRADCGCGQTHVRGWWGGRFKDLITTQGRSFMLMDVEKALKTVPDITAGGLEYVVVRPAEGSVDPLALRVEVGDGFGGDRADLRGRVEAALAEAMGVRTTVEVLDREALGRSGYKATRVVDP
jgi:phenylacetate-CoA ligase